MKQILILILAIPTIVSSQSTSTFDSALISLKKSNQIDSVYAENDFTSVIHKSSTLNSSTAKFHGDKAAPKEFEIVCVQKEVTQIGYLISTYFKKQKQSTWYFDTSKLLEAKVYFTNGKATKVEIFNENIELDYYLALTKGTWLTYRPQNEWKPTDEGWAHYEMIKAMLLKR